MRSAALAAAALFAIVAVAAPATADLHGLPLPPGTRATEEGAFKSSRGFRATVRFYSRHLDRRGIAHRAIPVYRHRGVDVARFLAARERSPWAAIHVYRRRGTTYIAIVNGRPLDPNG